MDIKVESEIVIGEVERTADKKIQVSLVKSNIGEYIAVTDTYMDRDMRWKKGKGKWLPVDTADEVAALILAGYKKWEEC